MKKLFKYLLYFFMIVLALDVATVLIFAHYRPPVPKSDAVIILGAAINTPALYNRTLTGLDYYKQGKAAVLMLSGGRISDQDISEAGYMQKIVRENSSPVPPLLLDDQSHNTYENLENSKAKLGGPKSVIIVSDEFHLARAVLLAKRIGFAHVSWDAPAPTYYSKGDLVRYYLREMAAMLRYVPRFVTG
jgi:uncharacterized SAM-binding protein YcdF (DUF218 family)